MRSGQPDGVQIEHQHDRQRAIGEQPHDARAEEDKNVGGWLGHGSDSSVYSLVAIATCTTRWASLILPQHQGVADVTRVAAVVQFDAVSLSLLSSHWPPRTTASLKQTNHCRMSARTIATLLFDARHRAGRSPGLLFHGLQVNRRQFRGFGPDMDTCGRFLRICIALLEAVRPRFVLALALDPWPRPGDGQGEVARPARHRGSRTWSGGRNRPIGPWRAAHERLFSAADRIQNDLGIDRRFSRDEQLAADRMNGRPVAVFRSAAGKHQAQTEEQRLFAIIVMGFGPRVMGFRGKPLRIRFHQGTRQSGLPRCPRRRSAR